MDGAGIILDKQTADEAATALFTHISSYSWLASFYYSKQLMLFRVRPKLHYLFHQASQIKAWQLNMLVLSTTHEETFLGKIKKIAVACHGKTATARLYQRYILCLALLVRQHRVLEQSHG